MSNKQLYHPIWSLPRVIDVEKLKDLHFLLQDQPPQDVGGKKIPLGIWHYLTQGNHQEHNKFPSNLWEWETESGHEHPLKEGDVTTIDCPSPGGLVKHPHCQRDVVVQTQDILVPLEDGCFHPALQGRKICRAIGFLASCL